jgi:nuclear pore complex protein Nup210
LGSDLHVVKGIEIGQEVVNAKLVEPELEHVVDAIVLTIAEAMSLDPRSPVLITVGSVISYKLRIIRLNTAQGNPGFINVQLGLKINCSNMGANFFYLSV